jgi:guanylate kinase
MKRTHRLIILTGPSCTGKTPLYHAMREFYPRLGQTIQKIVLYTTRSPRPGEQEAIDYFFRSRRFINQLRNNEDFLVMDVRGDIQALDLTKLQLDLYKSDILYEGNTFIALKLLYHPRFQNIAKLSIFLSPLSNDEIKVLTTDRKKSPLSEYVNILMKSKLKRRLYMQGKNLTVTRKQNINVRAEEAYVELTEAWRFDYILPNHDGEESENWNLLPHPIGEAAKTINSFYQILIGKCPANIEKWSKKLIP